MLPVCVHLTSENLFFPRCAGPPTLSEPLKDRKVKIGEIVELSVTGKKLVLLFEFMKGRVSNGKR